MKKFVIIFFLFLTTVLMAEKLSITVTNVNNFYNIDGTKYYLKIPLCLKLSVMEEAVLDTDLNKIYFLDSYSDEVVSYNNVKYYEKINLPHGTLNQFGSMIWYIYVPTEL